MDRFNWLQPPYEGVTDKMPFDLLIGKRDIRSRIESGELISEILDQFEDGTESFFRERRRYLIY